MSDELESSSLKEEVTNPGTPALSTSPGVPLVINSSLITPESQMPGGDLFSETAARSNYILIQFTELPTIEQEKQLSELNVQFCRFMQPVSWLARFEPQDLSPIRNLPFVLYANAYHENLSLNPEWVDQLERTNRTRGIIGSTRSLTSSAASQPSTELHDTIIMLHTGARDPEEMRGYLTSHHGIPKDRLFLELQSLSASLTAEEILKIAKIDDVERIVPKPEAMPHCHLMRGITKLSGHRGAVQKAYESATTGRLLLDGSGEVIAIADTGLDDGVSKHAESTNPEIRKIKDHPFFLDRIKYLDPRSNDVGQDWDNKPYDRINKTDDIIGHGTHVAGIALGKYTNAKSDPNIQLEGTLIEGMAPGAGLVMQAIMGSPRYVGNGGVKHNGMCLIKEDFAESKLFYDPYFGYPDKYTTSFDNQALRPAPDSKLRQPDIKVRIHHNSHGATEPKVSNHGYNPGGKLIDIITYMLPEYFIVFTAGNSGDDMDVKDVFMSKDGGGQITDYAASKNAMVVGACFNNQYIKTRHEGSRTDEPSQWDHDSLYSRYLSPKAEPVCGEVISSDNIPRLSSRGPVACLPAVRETNTHRHIIKPDLVAPGVAIYSARSRNAWSALEPYFGHSLVNNYWCSFMTGTSMAAPVVSGAAALLRQALRQRGTLSPSSALIKALMINGAFDLSLAEPKGGKIWRGNSITATGAGSPDGEKWFAPEELLTAAPDNAQGFGRLDVSESVGNVFDTKLCGFFDAKLTETENSRTDHRLRQGEKRTHSAIISPPPPKEATQTASLKVTLVWTDPPGEGLQNQLALSIKAKDAIYARHNTGVYIPDPKKGDDPNPDPKVVDPKLVRMANNNVQKLVVRNISISQGGCCTLDVVVTAVRIVPDPDPSINKKDASGAFVDKTPVKTPQGYAICWKVWYAEPEKQQKV